MDSALDSELIGPGLNPGARFSKVPETFRAPNAIFSSSTNIELYTPETCCMKSTSVRIRNKTAL